jgi:hypothetical protein
VGDRFSSLVWIYSYCADPLFTEKRKLTLRIFEAG